MDVNCKVNIVDIEDFLQRGNCQKKDTLFEKIKIRFEIIKEPV